MLTRVISVLLLAAITGFHPDHDSEAVEAGRLTQGPSLPTTCDVGQLFVNTIALPERILSPASRASLVARSYWPHPHPGRSQGSTWKWAATCRSQPTKGVNESSQSSLALLC